MQTTLFVLIDFSPASATLLEFARNWSRLLEADIRLVHQVYGMAPVLTDAESKLALLQAEQQEAEYKLQELIRSCELPRHKTTIAVTAGNLAGYLRQELQLFTGGIIVTGLKGTSPLKQLFIGSTPLKLIEEADQLVIAVPAHASTLPPHTLNVALHYKHPINQAAFAQLLEQLQPHVQTLNFFSVVTANDDAAATTACLEETSQAYATRYHTSNYQFVGEQEQVFNEIKNYLQGREGYLVVQEGSRTLRDQLFRRFLINDLIYDGSLPLIVLPA
ncbi:MAG TPA: universal stress protein [Lacibacter sp.]|nr:universal stress protein [Lacibacter sp.]HMO89267.1 universal stress protein [Lacibacter sp.]HMP86052.1 universal stress protein [Lacibacter sp.]